MSKQIEEKYCEEFCDKVLSYIDIVPYGYQLKSNSFQQEFDLSVEQLVLFGTKLLEKYPNKKRWLKDIIFNKEIPFVYNEILKRSIKKWMNKNDYKN